MSTFDDRLDALVDALEAATEIDRVATILSQQILTAGEIIGAVNGARVLADDVLETLDSVVGVDSAELANSLIAQVVALQTVANVSLQQARNPREITLEAKSSARQIVFEQFGSLAKLADFIEMNAASITSTNFFDAGDVVRLPRS